MKRTSGWVGLVWGAWVVGGGCFTAEMPPAADASGADDVAAEAAGMDAPGADAPPTDVQPDAPGPEAPAAEVAVPMDVPPSNDGAEDVMPDRAAEDALPVIPDADAAPEAAACAPPMTLCGAACVSTATDAMNCGRCANACACPAGVTPRCATGACECVCAAVGTTLCGAPPSCVRTATSSMHCGMCGRMCPSGSVCADGNCVPAQVHALHPPLVDGTSGTIVLEGAFGATATVAFPGAAMPVPATVLGPSRLRVDVPASATAGSLVVNSAGSTATTAQRFRRASFRLGLQPFRSRYEQADYARQTPSLGTARVRAASVHTGAWLYVIGGADTRGEALDSIERAMINADGTLGAFQANAVGLGAAREGAAAIRVGGGVYLLGGAARGAAVRTVERAAVNTSGMLDAFVSLSAEAAPLALRTARSGLVAEVIGGYVYVFGGGTMDVERAPIRTDGTLGAFATVVGVTTRARRTRPTIQVVGGFVYLMGGSDGGVALQTVERAAISADGDLGDFALTESLTVARDGAASVVLGNRVYVAGGAGAAGALDSIEYAESMPDGGALGPFVAVPSATNRLSTARGGAASTVVGNYWYLVGGASAAPLAGIDRAEINASGVFGTPRNLPAPGLAGPRILPTAVAIGRYIYVLGGSGPDGFDDTRGTERAPVLDDGSLGAFVGYPPVSAATQYRAGAEVAVIGASLYVFGGRRNTSTFLETALRMQILDDGSLGPPSTTFSGTTLTFGRAMVLSDRVCVFGGTHGGGTSDTIGCARINASGALEPFAAQAVQLPGVRNYAAGALINDNVYLLGGTNGSAILDSIVRCVVPGDVSSCALHERRLSRPIQLPFGAMIGNALIYAGGQSSAGVRFGTDLERVPILADSVGGGATVAGVVLPLGLYYHSTLVIDNTLWLLGGETALGIARSHQVVELR